MDSKSRISRLARHERVPLSPSPDIANWFARTETFFWSGGGGGEERDTCEKKTLENSPVRDERSESWRGKGGMRRG